MTIDPATTEIGDFYQLLSSLVVPRPIGWISTTSRDGVDNLAPYSFFNAVAANPPAVMFSGTRGGDGRHKDSVQNALDTGEFVTNAVTVELAEQMNRTSASVAAGESEFDVAGLERVASGRVRPPGVMRSPARMECRVIHHFDVGTGPRSATVVVGEVLLLHTGEGLLVDGAFDAGRLDAVGRLGGSDYATTRDRFALSRPE